MTLGFAGLVHGMKKSADAETLLARARENLRCIEWESLSYELMSSNRGSAEDYEKSRPVRKAERIDFFMSHRRAPIPVPRVSWLCA